MSSLFINPDSQEVSSIPFVWPKDAPKPKIVFKDCMPTPPFLTLSDMIKFVASTENLPHKHYYIAARILGSDSPMHIAPYK